MVAKVHAIGDPVNESEIKAITFFRDKLSEEHHIYHNFEFSTDNNNPYEYDMVILHDKAIFCIEVKGWHGTIVGNANQWRIGNIVRKNPVLTNNNKKRVLQSYLSRHHPDLTEETVPIESLVVLTEESTERKLHGNQSFRVLHLQEALQYIETLQGAVIHPGNRNRLEQFFKNQFRPLSHKGRIREFKIIEEVSRNDRLGYVAYLCEHEIIESKTYLLKIYNFDYLETPDLQEDRRRMIERDARILHRMVVHKHVVDPEPPFYHSDGRFVLPLEWVDGLSLGYHFDQIDDDKEPAFEFAEALKIAEKACDSLYHAHKFDVVHRNLSPRSLVIPPDGELKLVNFDFAKIEQYGTISSTAELDIEEDYAAPEIRINGPGKATRQSDIYSLGVILFQLFTGQHPYEDINDVLKTGGLPKRPSDIIPTLSAELDALITTMCKVKAEERYQDLGKVLEIIQNISPTPGQAYTLIGKTLSGKYELNRQIARGGESVVYEGIETAIPRVVAIKVWNQSRIREQAHVSAIQHLVRLSAFQHIADFYTFDKDDELGVSYMVMEHAANGTLEDRIEDGKLEPHVAQPIVKQICLALKAMHEHDIVHLDIKPSNILFDEENQVQVADFGISQLIQNMDDGEDRTTSRLRGTLGYIAPELIGNSQGTTQSDIYSLGIMLHEMLTGKSPQEHHVSIDGIDSSLPQALITVLEKATQVDLEERYKTIDDFSKAFNHAVNSLSMPKPVKDSKAQLSLIDRIKSLFRN